MNIKTKLTTLTLSLILCGSCQTFRQSSRFVSSDIQLGMSQKAFIDKYGKPFNREIERTANGSIKETLFYKETFFRTVWYDVTTSFTFVDSVLTKQEVYKEEPLYNEHEK